jgi:hypothetical protein
MYRVEVTYGKYVEEYDLIIFKRKKFLWFDVWVHLHTMRGSAEKTSQNMIGILQVCPNLRLTGKWLF